MLDSTQKAGLTLKISESGLQRSSDGERGGLNEIRMRGPLVVEVVIYEHAVCVLKSSNTVNRKT